MDPRERPFDEMDGVECAACGRPVPPERVRLLARREDLAFAELPCDPCGSVSLAIIVGDAAAADAPHRAAVIGPDDVLEMHQFLAAWHGDLRTLVSRRRGAAERPGRP